MLDRAVWFLSGAICAAASMSLFQDSLGKAAYIAYVQENWVEPSASIPAALFFLAFSGYLLASSPDA